MKKIAAIFAVSTIAASLFAGGIDSKTNLSTGYHRNPSRNTEHERPEASLYNIAGTGFIADGLYLELGDQVVFKNYSDKYSGKNISYSLLMNGTYEDKEVVYFYPDFDFVYKRGDFAFFGVFAVAGGGGTLNYDKGTAATAGLLYSSFYNKMLPKYGASAAKTSAFAISKAHSLEVYSVTYGETIGLSYKLNDVISFAAAARFLESQQDLTLSCSSPVWMLANLGKDAGYSAFGWGIGGIFGVHVKPTENFDIAVQYKTITKMDVEFKSMKGLLASSLLGGAKTGDSYYNDMPSEINAGIGYRVIEPLYINASFNYYFNRWADISNALAKDSKMDYMNSWECGGGVDWTINDRLLASCGIMYSNQGSSQYANNLFAPVLDCVNVGAGLEVKATEKLTLTGGIVYAKYFEKDYRSSGLDLALNKDVTLFSLGVTFKPL